MANVQGRRQRKNEIKTVDQQAQRIVQLEAENNALRDIISKLEQVNEDRNAEIKRLRSQQDDSKENDIVELVPFSDVSSLPNSRPTTVETDKYDQLEPTMTSGIVEHVRNALLTNVNVPEEKKPMGNSDVLVVYFQVTSSFKEIYGYSVINHSFLENPQTLQMIDNKDNIQLYLHRNAKKRIELQAAGTISIVVHSDLQIESMSVTTFVEPGDIVLWIRTNLEVNVIKKTLSNLFQSMLNTLYVKCTNTERCERTIRDVDDIANIIKGEYKDIVIRAPAKRPPAPAKLPPRGVSLSFDAYVNSIPVPREPFSKLCVSCV